MRQTPQAANSPHLRSSNCDEHQKQRTCRAPTEATSHTSRAAEPKMNIIPHLKSSTATTPPQQPSRHTSTAAEPPHVHSSRAATRSQQQLAPPQRQQSSTLPQVRLYTPPQQQHRHLLTAAAGPAPTAANSYRLHSSTCSALAQQQMRHDCTAANSPHLHKSTAKRLRTSRAIICIRPS